MVAGTKYKTNSVGFFCGLLLFCFFNWKKLLKRSCRSGQNLKRMVNGKGFKKVISESQAVT